MGVVGEQLAATQVGFLRGPFELEDKPIVEGVALNMGESSFWDLKPVLLSIDHAAVLARRILQKLVDAEHQPTNTASSR
jgi:vanillate O-demethylase oxygenase-like protein